MKKISFCYLFEAAILVIKMNELNELNELKRLNECHKNKIISEAKCLPNEYMPHLDIWNISNGNEWDSLIYA